MIWSALTATRNTLYDKGYLKSYKSALPVISIGNLTVGGNGKTPLAIYLCKLLSRLGFHPVILLRGYKGKLSGPVLVEQSHTSADVGDEAKLISRETRAPVVVCRKRAIGARFIEQKGLGNLIILDDGLQHRALGRDIDLVTVFTGTPKAKSEFIRGKVLPFGKFREGRDAALKRVHGVIISERRPVESEEVDASIVGVLPKEMTVFKSQLRPRLVRKISHTREHLTPQPCVAFCGLANPEGFFQSLESQGFTVTEKVSFPDHHRFKRKDVVELQERFPKLPLICTTKDAVKIQELDVGNVYELVTDMHVTPEDTFLELLFSRIRGSHELKE